ncbi:MAG TPA: hypothetical protein VNW97_05125 [Candidatus Saccharimonadales bacterium]|jgi:uncharacterized Zn finger protein|nr:hypothetical protein [Candidatus Saccharimonadales bacterium]
MTLSKDWASLTWDQLASWAGSRAVSHGRSYQRSGHVQDLAISAEGRLLATVIGGSRYSVTVCLQLEEGGSPIIKSLCTCPVMRSCKHAVATVAAYLDMLGQNKLVPPISGNDIRLEELEPVEEDDSDLPDDFDEDEDEKPRRASIPAVRPGSRQDWDTKIREHINAKGQKELTDLVWSLTQRFPELHQEFRERIALKEGDAGQLLRQAQQELQRVTSSPGWSNHWRGQSSIPDYSGLIRRLERLTESGHADAVVELGEELIERGISQINESNDEGETASALAECLPIIFEAVAASSLTPAQKLLFGIDAILRDDYDLIGGAADDLMDDDFEPVVWSEVAGVLSGRLATDAQPQGEDGFSRSYRRDQLSGWLTEALRKAGRNGEVLAVYESEARQSGSYERLVNFLLEQKRYEEAGQWAIEGIQKTAARYPGIASKLAEVLCENARRRHQWDVVAAHAAWKFFERPTPDGFNKLEEVAALAGCAEKVQKAVQLFLETGVLPIRKPDPGQSERETISAEWPLPIPGYILEMMKPDNRPAPRPHYEVLIDMAIAAKQPESVLAWYDRMRAEQPHQRMFYGSGSGSYADRVAAAVTEIYPQRALDIYSRIVRENLPHAKPTAYETVVAYLRKMRPILKSLDREIEWQQTLADIRLHHRNRPRFMEMLAGLDDRPILETQKKGR